MALGADGIYVSAIASGYGWIQQFDVTGKLAADYDGSVGSSVPVAMASVSDGSVIFMDCDLGGQRYNPNGRTFSSVGIPATDCAKSLAASSDASTLFWTSDDNSGEIEAISSLRGRQQFVIPTTNSKPEGIAIGPDNAVWFVEQNGNNIGRLDLNTSVVNEYGLPAKNSSPENIVKGPDNAMWFTETNGKIGRIDPSTKVIGEFKIPNGYPTVITSGTDQSLWFGTEIGGGYMPIGRITTTGQISLYSVEDFGDYGTGITLDKAGNVWFSGSQVVGFLQPSVAVPMSSQRESRGGNLRPVNSQRLAPTPTLH
jgi:virginiamycin B lyase